MEKDNVYVLFEEIKNKIEMVNGKLEQKAGTPTDEQAEEVIPTCVRHIHRHSFDIRSSRVFSLLIGMGVVCSLSLWGNIRLWQSNRQYADVALKFRAIRSWSGCTPEDILWLNKVFDIHRDEKAIEWVRKRDIRQMISHLKQMGKIRTAGNIPHPEKISYNLEGIEIFCCLKLIKSPLNIYCLQTTLD